MSVRVLGLDGRRAALSTAAGPAVPASNQLICWVGSFQILIASTTSRSRVSKQQHSGENCKLRGLVGAGGGEGFSALRLVNFSNVCEPRARRSGKIRHRGTYYRGPGPGPCRPSTGRPLGATVGNGPAAADLPAVLDVFARDLRQPAPAGRELRDDCEWLARVDGLAGAPEVALAARVRVVPGKAKINTAQS